MIQKFSFEKTNIDGLILINPFVAWDERGYFIKDYSKEVFEQNGIVHELKEVFYTNSHKGVIRALHFQREKTQPKLVRCVSGKIFDVAVDMRKDSPTFGQWQGFYLSEENKKELLIPGYCAHGYLVIEPSIVSYKCAEKFYGEFDDGVIWDDKEINVKWPVEEIGTVKVILADKDKKLKTFEEFKRQFGSL